MLLIDPLSNDPLICTGSANFSKNSLIANDENMLLIRGETRVADIYISEIDRIFRHFFARNAVNDIATRTKGKGKNPNWLDPGFGWIDSNFDPSSYKCARRLAFFPNGAQSLGWAAKAEFDPDPFIDEAERPAKWRKEGSRTTCQGGRREKVEAHERRREGASKERKEGPAGPLAWASAQARTVLLDALVRTQRAALVATERGFHAQLMGCPAST